MAPISRNFLKARIGGLLIKSNVEPDNNPPVWLQQPNPTFVQGTASDYSIIDLGSDPDGDPLSVDINDGTVSLPSGVTWNQSLGELSYDGVGALNSTSGHIATLNDGTDTTDSSSFSVIIESASAIPNAPALSSYWIRSKVFGEDNATGAAQRAAIAKYDVVVLPDLAVTSFFMSGPTAQPGWLTHAEAVADLKSRNPNLQIFWYFNGYESSDGSTTGDKLSAETGPPGAETYWGAGNNDWWGRNSSGDRVFTAFGRIINCTKQVTPDSNGYYFGEWYARTIIQPFINQLVSEGVTADEDGFGIYIDNFLEAPNRSGVDWDGDGQNEDADDEYDPENPAHDPHYVALSEEWREGRQDIVDTLRTLNSGIQVIGNLSLWARYSGTLPNPNKVLPSYQKGGEYSADIQGGIAEGLTTNEFSPISGVDPSGNRSGGGTWQEAYNRYEYICRVTDSPKLAQGNWFIWCADRLADSPEGNAVYSEVPDPNSEWGLMRWALATSLMNDGYFDCTGVVVGATREGFFSNTIQFDEFGTINTGTTGLSKGWLGQPVDDPQIASRSGQASNIWVREFDNGLAILNTENDNTAGATLIDVSALPGGTTTWKRINGFQDSTTNNNANVTADFNLDPVDGLILERRP